MKSTFKLGSIEISGVKLNNIEFTQEYTATEAISLISFGKSFMKDIIKELPEIMEDLANVQAKIEELDERFEHLEIIKEMKKAESEIIEMINALRNR